MADAPTTPVAADAPIVLDGTTVLVCGARFAGQAATRALLARGARVMITDRTEPEGLAALLAAGAQFAGPLERVPEAVTLVVTSPGWSPSHPLFADAAARGIEVLGEVEFAWRLRGARAAKWLVLTGTNGKTTTVRMLESMLLAGGRRALAVGNVGVSIIDAVTGTEPYDTLAVEASSYQLFWSSTVRPLAGALLNLAPDHLDWHGSMEHYERAKAKVWTADVAIGNADDPRVARLLADATTGQAVRFRLGEPADGELGVVGDRLVSRAFGDDGADLGAVLQVRPAGAHNVANALAAAALARAAGITPAAIADGLRRFVPGPAPEPTGARRGRHQLGRRQQGDEPARRTRPRCSPTRGSCGSPAASSRASTRTRWWPRSLPAWSPRCCSVLIGHSLRPLWHDTRPTSR